MDVRGRLRKFIPAELDEEQRALYESITTGPRASGPALFALTDGDGALEGPFNAMLLSPPLGEALQALGGAIRYRSALPARAREIAILVVARVWDSGFERYAHEAVGRAAGLTNEELATIRAGSLSALPDKDDRLVAVTAWALSQRSDLTDAEYAEAREGLGLPALFELTTLIGYYATLALQLRAFRVSAPSSGDGPRG